MIYRFYPDGTVTMEEVISSADDLPVGTLDYDDETKGIWKVVPSIPNTHGNYWCPISSTNVERIEIKTKLLLLKG